MMKLEDSFAYVSWPMHHQLHSTIGKPYELWCCSLNESLAGNCIIPMQNIVSYISFNSKTDV